MGLITYLDDGRAEQIRANKNRKGVIACLEEIKNHVNENAIIMYDATADLDTNQVDVSALGFVSTKPAYLIVSFTPTTSAAVNVQIEILNDTDSNIVGYYLPTGTSTGNLHTFEQAVDFTNVNLPGLVDFMALQSTNATITKVVLKQ